MELKKTIKIKKGEIKKEPEDFVLPYQVELWITGFPLKTDFGFINPIKIKDYPKYTMEFEFLKLQGWEVINMVLKEMNDKVKRADMAKTLKDNSFLTCVKNNVGNLRTIYVQTFSKFIIGFDAKMFWRMTQSQFDNLRRMMLDFNNIQYHEKNPNPRIEQFNRIKPFIASRTGGVIEFDTVFTTLMTKEGGGHLPSDINNLTIRQYYLAFKRVEFNKAHDTTILFKTVDSKDGVKIVDWFKSSRVTEGGDKEYGSVDELKKGNAFLNGGRTSKGEFDTTGMKNIKSNPKK